MADSEKPSSIPGNAKNYWYANLKVVGVLLAIWFVAGYVLSIFLVDRLNEFHIGQLGFGFWFAQQGSILVFVVLVLVYALLMDYLDRRYQVGNRE